MLAVQRAPRMGSSQLSSDPFHTYGCTSLVLLSSLLGHTSTRLTHLAIPVSVDSDQEDLDPPLQDPPEPARGAPLLSENDSKVLHDFFSDLTAEHYSMPSFGEGLNFSEAWADLPPQFMGTSTNLGQQNGFHLASPSPVQPTHGFGLPDFGNVLQMGSQTMPPPPPPPPPPPLHSVQSHLAHSLPSEDVLNAAATLFNNNPSNRFASNGMASLYERRTVPPPEPVGHLRHQPLEDFREDNRRSSLSNEMGNSGGVFSDLVFGLQNRHLARPEPPAEYQWGSDANFNHVQGYTTHSEKETAESITKEQLKYLECFQPSQSADNTRASSPSHGQMAPPPPQMYNQAPGPVKAKEGSKVPGVPDVPPRKRRKSKIVKETKEMDVDDNASTSGRRRKVSKSEHMVADSSPPANNTITTTTAKRRKSGATAPKASRENLSEEQKRENHIRSEQKRRTLIKEGFDDLCELVPGLQGGGFSKSTMLAMAADWLDDLLKGNDVLTEKLALLEAP